jgi:CubicO group peptidase (beta-lactamase class C family)
VAQTTNEDKMKHAKIIIQMALSLMASLGLNAQSDNPELDHYFLRKMEKSGRIGMQAAYISNGELTWAGSYGVKTFQTNDRVNDSTLFMIASTSKPLTALALMKLYDQEKLKLDDDINEYLPFDVSNPNFPDDIITFRMILSHVSTIRDHWPTLEIDYTIDDGGDSPISLEDFLKSYLVPGGKYYKGETNFYTSEPGSQYHYSNVGYDLIGYLVQRISGRPFNEYMAEEIFKPLQMDNTFWFLSEIPHDNIATPHNMPYKETDYKGTQILKHFGYPGYPSGQLRTTVSDYAQLLKLMINQGQVEGIQFLSKETVEEFLTVQYPEVAKWQAISWSYNEFENFIYNLIMPRRPSHTGLDPGMNSVVSFDPSEKTGVLIISNSPTTTLWNEKMIYLDMVKKLFKEAEKAYLK